VKRATKHPTNIVVISDTHCGCRLGLCPPSVTLDDGGIYTPSSLQKKVWALWLEFWHEWVPRVTRGEPWDLVMNGDALDGVHHGATTQISQNLKDQATIAEMCLRPVVTACLRSGGRYYHIRGTEAHVGKSGAEEERLAKELNAVPNEDGQHARWELWKRIGQGKGHLCHFLHHIGTTGSTAYESTALHKEMVESFVEAGRWGDEPPQVIVRSHRHRHFETRIAVGGGYGIATVTPAWQLKTPFTYRLPGARIAQPQFGGILIRAGDEELHSRFFVRRIERPKEG
jgi:hypothetical protein